MEEHLEYTRKDDQRITEMYALMPVMNQKIDDLAGSIKACQGNCMGNRSGFNKRLKIVEEKIKGDRVIQSWKDAIFSKSTAIVLFIIAAVDFVLRFIPDGK